MLGGYAGKIANFTMGSRAELINETCYS